MIHLIGTYDKDATDYGGSIAWAVTFNNDQHGNSKSSTSWSGQRQIVDGNPIIYTTWILTSQTAASDNWESTTTNQDLFFRHYPKDEKICATLIAHNYKEYN